MANTSSAKKAARQAVKRTAVNRMRRSFVRTAVKKVEAMVAAGNRDGALEALKLAEPALMRAAQKGVVERNTASRKVSRLVHQVRRLEA